MLALFFIKRNKDLIQLSRDIAEIPTLLNPINQHAKVRN